MIVYPTVIEWGECGTRTRMLGYWVCSGVRVGSMDMIPNSSLQMCSTPLRYPFTNVHVHVRVRATQPFIHSTFYMYMYTEKEKRKRLAILCIWLGVDKQVVDNGVYTVTSHDVNALLKKHWPVLIYFVPYYIVYRAPLDEHITQIVQYV
jgi:hypothetical protein